MKRTITTCDHCKKDIASDKHITIGSTDDKSFCYENTTVNERKQMSKLAYYQNLHFCCKEHFVAYFFDEPKPLTEEQCEKEAESFIYENAIFNAAKAINRLDYVQGFEDGVENYIKHINGH